MKPFNMDGTPTVEGSYYATLDPEWSPREIIIDAGESTIPLSYTGLEGQMMTPNTTLGYAGAPLVPCSLADAKISKTTKDRLVEIHAVDQEQETPPDSVLENLDETQKEAFRQLWDRLPSHMRKIQFGLESKYWTVKDINELADVLCKYSHRFSKDKMDLGYRIVRSIPLTLLGLERIHSSGLQRLLDAV